MTEKSPKVPFLTEFSMFLNISCSVGVDTFLLSTPLTLLVVLKVQNSKEVQYNKLKIVQVASFFTERLLKKTLIMILFH